MNLSDARSPPAAIIAGTGIPVAGSMIASALLFAGIPSGSSLSFMVSSPNLSTISAVHLLIRAA
jgi:hypothetical protein